MSGSNTTDQQGFYGEIGVASTENVPGARVGAVGCYDSSRQEFWLFGGLSFDAYGCLGSYHGYFVTTLLIALSIYLFMHRHVKRFMDISSE